MFKNKKWVVILIVLIPSLLWIILETSTINSRKLPFYGPKVAQGTDTLYHSVKTEFEGVDSAGKRILFDTTNYPVLALMFIKDSYSNDAFRISGFWEYVNYNNAKIEHIPVILVCEKENGRSQTVNAIKQMAKKTDNIHFAAWNKNTFDSLNKEYFKEKPYYVDYSFFMLIDKKRHIRGYYDSRYVAEMKRLIGEYQHLRLKEEKQLLINANEIKTK
jgi:hypothetical protein